MWKLKWPALSGQSPRKSWSLWSSLLVFSSFSTAAVIVDAWVPELSSITPAAKLFFSFNHIHGSNITYTVCAGLQCWFSVPVTELWKYFLRSIFSVITALPAWGVGKKMVYFEGLYGRQENYTELFWMKWKCRTASFLLNFQEIQVNAAEVPQK